MIVGPICQSFRFFSACARGFCKASRNSARDMSSLVESAKPKIWFVGTWRRCGVIIGHRFGLRHAGIIDDDHFVARIGRARGQPAAAHQQLPAMNKSLFTFNSTWTHARPISSSRPPHHVSRFTFHASRFLPTLHSQPIICQLHAGRKLRLRRVVVIVVCQVRKVSPAAPMRRAAVNASSRHMCVGCGLGRSASSTATSTPRTWSRASAGTSLQSLMYASRFWPC